MTREEKTAIIQELTQSLQEASGFYLLNLGPLTAGETVEFRRALHERGLKLRVVKNTLMMKALKNAQIPQSDLFESVLHQNSAVIFYNSEPKEPALALEDFRKKLRKDYPVLKAAYVEETPFIGEEHLETLTRLKSRRELIAELVARLQSPLHRTLGALQSGGHTILALLESLSKRNA
ncbi:MAG: 50S ribosomal protein L10 [Bacteroidia bacterium]|nr:50S ribosomal protein L10 [Bacteroidia bacterium]MDW8133843.1 50S ribosomal protein L10 [Bacteroidia bacterium]